jgi:dTDP-4-dehydrorhamnose reductase
MKRTKVLVIGVTGMLGRMVAKVLADAGIEVIGTARTDEKLPFKTIKFDVNLNPVESLYLAGEVDYVINCVGITRPYIKDGNPDHTLNALLVNSVFPFNLSCFFQAANKNTRIIQIATDCVYSGTGGGYTEKSLCDPTDVYGKTKSLGEVEYENLVNLRTSIIGPEIGRKTFLLEWFLSQPKEAKLSGYVNHFWNGVTTLQFAKIALGIINHDKFDLLPRKQHVIPENIVSKYELLQIFASVFNRKDIEISKVETAKVDRTLGTVNPEINQSIWEAAGYTKPPTMEAMIQELA